MSDGHCKECVYRHNAGHKKGSRLASKYNNWCVNYSKKAADAVGHCKVYNGKKVASDE